MRISPREVVVDRIGELGLLKLRVSILERYNGLRASGFLCEGFGLVCDFKLLRVGKAKFGLGVVGLWILRRVFGLVVELNFRDRRLGDSRLNCRLLWDRRDVEFARAGQGSLVRKLVEPFIFHFANFWRLLLDDRSSRPLRRLRVHLWNFEQTGST